MEKKERQSCIFEDHKQFGDISQNEAFKEAKILETHHPSCRHRALSGWARNPIPGGRRCTGGIVQQGSVTSVDVGHVGVQEGALWILRDVIWATSLWKLTFCKRVSVRITIKLMYPKK